ncbi:MAG: nucleotidyltransferase family protein [Pseudomonadota bacterium]
MTEALILAAGRGERLRPVTDETPKPLLDDGRDVLLDRHLRALAAAGVERVVINLGWLASKIVAHVGDGSQFGLTVVYSPEGYPTLDTGGAIRKAIQVMADAPFWVVNADVHTSFDFANPPEHWLGCHDAAIGLVPKPAYVDRGDFALANGMASNAGATLLTFSGVSCYRPAFFAATSVERFSVVPLLRAAADSGQLSAFELDADWFDIGTPERLAHVRERVKKEVSAPDASEA